MMIPNHLSWLDEVLVVVYGKLHIVQEVKHITICMFGKHRAVVVMHAHGAFHIQLTCRTAASYFAITCSSYCDKISL